MQNKDDIFLPNLSAVARLNSVIKARGRSKEIRYLGAASSGFHWTLDGLTPLKYDDVVDLLKRG